MTDQCRAEIEVLLKRSLELELLTKELAKPDRRYSQSDFDDLKKHLAAHQAALEDFRARCVRTYQRQTSPA